MKTAHYTFTTWNERAMASGFDGAGAAGRQGALVREPQRPAPPLGRDNVIDLTAWRAANLAMPEEEPEELEWDGGDDGGEAEPELLLPAPRLRKSRRAALVAELVSTASVVVVTLAIILRVLAF
ncbi:MAG: hypothetical protein HFF28_05570 [Oscillospiraceae bacterium]|nr:hypothetical protein [Oscillospiraceae bacterium]